MPYGRALVASSAERHRLASTPSNDEDSVDHLDKQDWKAVRAKMISGGFGLKDEGSADGIEDQERGKPVAPRNDAILRLQNPKLVSTHCRCSLH